MSYFQKTPKDDPYLNVYYGQVGVDFDKKNGKNFRVELKDEAVELLRSYLTKTIL